MPPETTTAESIAIVVAGAVVLQVCLILLSFTSPKGSNVLFWLHLPSLVLAWGGYALYERLYIAPSCPGECNIRPDLLVIYPYLAFITLTAVGYAARPGHVRPRP